MNDSPDQASKQSPTQRLSAVELDDESLFHTNADIEHERKVAIFDLIEENTFTPVEGGDGPFHLHLSIVEKRLVFDIRRENGDAVRQLLLSLSPFRKIIKDYFLMCESYYEAIRTASPSQIEAIDMGRRGLHNEGSQVLQERLSGKVEIDFSTARRLFTLIYVLHMKG